MYKYRIHADYNVAVITVPRDADKWMERIKL